MHTFGVDIMCLPDFAAADTGERYIALTRTETGFFAGDIAVELRSGKVTVTADKTPLKNVRLRWHGSTGEGVRCLSDAVERGYGNLGWYGLMPHRYLPWYTILSDGTRSAGYGVATGPDMLAFWQCDAQGITLTLDTRCGTRGVTLGGITLSAQLIAASSDEGENPFAFACRFCRMLCPSPLLPEKPVYGSNNWYYAYGKSSEADILTDSEVVARLTEGLANRPFMVIDDGWQQLAPGVHASGRPYYTGNEKFPDMAALADIMRARGVRPGIWCRPIWTLDERDGEGIRSARNREYLDLTVPETLEIVASDIDRLTAEWGYELIKYDFTAFDTFGVWGFTPEDYLHLPGNWSWHDGSVTNAQATKTLYKTIYEHSHGAVIIGCNVIGHLAAGYIHLHRSGDDTSGYDWERSYLMGVNTLAFRLPQHNAFYLADPDCVGITGAIPWEYNRQLLQLFAASGEPLFVSAKPSELTPEIERDLRAAFAAASRAEDTLEPLDWLYNTHPAKYLHNGMPAEFSWLPPGGFRGVYKK